MKILKFILNFILSIILIACIIIFTVAKIGETTIFSKKYLENKLEESKYYESILGEVKSNLENYIGPSGLESSILDNTYDIETIKKDTALILGNICNGEKNSIDTTEMRNKLKENIANELKGVNISLETQASIDELIEHICSEYESTILHTQYEEKISKLYTEAGEIASKTTIAAIVIGITSVAIIMLLNIKEITKGINYIGISLTSSGLFFEIFNFIINLKTKITNIKILNESISSTIQMILTDFLKRTFIIGAVLITVGCIIIIFSNGRKYKEK